MITREDIEWGEADRSFRLGGWDFLSAHWEGDPDPWVPGEDCFHLTKTHALIEQYLRFFNALPAGARFDNVVELGLLHGASVPFWFEVLQPERYVGFDVQDRANPPLLDRYILEKGLGERVQARWRTDTTKERWVTEGIQERIGDELLDVVIDDASHQYEATKQSFEFLFPHVRPYGYYIIEDWAWFHWEGLEQKWAGQTPTTRLVQELVEAAGSNYGRYIESLYVCSGFTAVKRGWLPREELEGFSLDRATYRHPR